MFQKVLKVLSSYVSFTPKALAIDFSPENKLSFFNKKPANTNGYTEEKMRVGLVCPVQLKN